jgi:hypothetical protein
MKISHGLVVAWVALAQCQTYPECTRELLRTDDCAAVANPNACYNQFRWNTRTLSCIDGTDDADRKRKVCPDSPLHGVRKTNRALSRPANVAAALGLLCAIGSPRVGFVRRRMILR